MIVNNFYLNLLRLGWVIASHSYLDSVVSVTFKDSYCSKSIGIFSFIVNIGLTVNCTLYILIINIRSECKFQYHEYSSKVVFQKYGDENTRL